jgi:hypothetical protein
MMQASKHRVCAPSLQVSPLPSVEVLPARRLLASRSAFHYCQQVNLLLLPAGQPIIFASIPASLLPAGQPLIIIPCLSTFYFASRSASNYCRGQPLSTTVSVPSSPLPLPQANVSPRNQRVGVGVPFRMTGENLAICLLCVLCSQYAIPLT